MKKRFLSVIFILCLAVALSLSVSAESNKLTYTVGASAPTVSANTEFTILVQISENTGICWLTTLVEYDSSVLTYVGASTDTSKFNNAKITCNDVVSGSKGTVNVVLGTMESIFASNPTIYTNTGNFVELKFKVNADAPLGTSTIKTYTKSGYAVKIINSVADYSFDINTANTIITIGDGKHLTCTPAAPIIENVVNPTCYYQGSYDNVVKCSVCGKELSRETVRTETTSHTPGAPVKDVEVPGTCQAEGFYTSVVKCTVCNYKISSETVKTSKTDHTPAPAIKENLKEATCTTVGSYDEVIKCSVCSTMISKQKKTIAKKDHQPGAFTIENIVDATCLKPGSYDTVTHCLHCNIVISSVKSEIAISPHTIASSTKENLVQATCTKAGSYDEVYYCAVCHVEISRSSKTIPVVDHTPGPAPTETAAQVCLVCNTVLKPAAGHTHKWESTLKSDVSGHWYPCSGCNEKKDSSTHAYDNTCDADCNVCGFKRTPADHAYGNWVTVKEPTDTVEGQRERSCIICGKKVTESIPTTAPVTTTPPATTAPVETTAPSPETSADEVTSEQTPGTTAPESKDPEQTTEPVIEDPGCGSVVSAGIAIIAILGTAIVMKKRD